jgi:plastocyanin
VTLSEFAITPATITAPLHGTLVVANSGAVAHNFNVKGTGLKTKDLEAGGSTTLELGDLKAGSYTVFCAIAGHEQAGMRATLVVGGTGAASGAGDMANMDFNAMTRNSSRA